MSNDDLDLDPFDDALGRELRGAAPSAPDADRTLDALRPRLARARARRRAAVIGTSGFAASLVVALVVALGAASGTREIRTPPATRPHRPATSTTAPSTPTSVPGQSQTPTTGVEPDGRRVGPPVTAGGTTPATEPEDETETEQEGVEEPDQPDESTSGESSDDPS